MLCVNISGDIFNLNICYNLFGKLKVKQKGSTGIFIRHIQLSAQLGGVASSMIADLVVAKINRSPNTSPVILSKRQWVTLTIA